MTKITLPVGFSYSMNNPDTPKRVKNKISREEFRKFIQAGMTYKEVNEKIPISPSTYIRMLDKNGYQRDHVRIKMMREKNIVNMVKAGMTYKEISKEIPIARCTYDQILDEYGIPKDHIRTKTMRQDSIKSMLEAGKPIEEIAEANNITVPNCKQILRNMGITYHKFIESEKKAEIENLIKTTNLNQKQIAEKLGVSVTKARAIFKQLDLVTVNTNKKEFTQSLKKSTVQGWLDKYKTITNISKNVHLNPGTIRKYMKFFGLHK